MEKKDSEKKQRNKWLALINIPLQMGIIIFVFAYAGKWIDEKYSIPNALYSKVITLFGVFLALYNVYRQVKNIGTTEQ